MKINRISNMYTQPINQSNSPTPTEDLGEKASQDPIIVSAVGTLGDVVDTVNFSPEAKALADKASSTIQPTEQVHMPTIGSDETHPEYQQQPSLDMIITDYNMPEMTGSEFLEGLREYIGETAYQDIVKVGMSGEDYESAKTLFENVKVDKIARKPTGLIQFLSNIEEYLPNKQSQILIADDEESVRQICMDFLQSKGYTNIITASDGEEALEIAKGFYPNAQS